MPWACVCCAAALYRYRRRAGRQHDRQSAPARHALPADPVGKRIRLINDGNIPAPQVPSATVVGVAPTIASAAERDPIR
jgi:hypothetical protein